MTEFHDPMARPEQHTLWLSHFFELRNKPIRFLEIGVYEGRNACWLLDVILTNDGSRYVGIDNWTHVAPHRAKIDQPVDIERRAFDNLRSFGQKVCLIKGHSAQVLQMLRPDSFDFIYIDGNHWPGPVQCDADRSWPLLKRGGVMVFDDYKGAQERDPNQRPQVGIDTFLSGVFDPGFEILWQGYQFAIRKL